MNTAEFDVILGTRALPGNALTDRETSEETAKPDDVSFSEELFEAIKGTTQKWREQVVEDRDFYYISQWDARKERIMKRRRQTPLTIDCISPAVEQAVAMLTANSPRFSTTGREDSDVRKGRLFAEILTWIFEKSIGRSRLKVAIREAYVSSAGYFVIYWNQDAENGRGEIQIKTVDALNVFVDTAATEQFWADAPHMVIAGVKAHEQYVAQNPAWAELLENADPYTTDINPVSKRVSQVSSGSAERLTDTRLRKYLELDRYSRIRHPMIYFFEPKSMYEKLVEKADLERFLEQTEVFIRRSKDGDEYFVDPESVANAKATMKQLTNVFHLAQMPDGSGINYVKGPEDEPDPNGSIPIPESTVYIIPTNMAGAVKAQRVQMTERLVDRIKRVYSIGGKLAHVEILPTSHYPIVPLVFHYDRTVAPISDVRRVKGQQEYINDVNSLIVAHMEKTTNFKVGYTRGAYNERELNEMWADPSKTFIPMEPEGGTLVPLSPAPPPNELYKNLSDAKADIERTLGVYAVQQGDPSQAPDTYRGALALEEFGQRRMKSKKDDVEEFLTQCGRVLVDFVQAYYTDHRVMRLMRPNGKQYEIAVNTIKAEDVFTPEADTINDISVGKYDLVVVAGSMLPSNRWATLEHYKELAKMGAIDAEELLRKSEHPDPESVLERISMVKQLQGQLQQAMQKIKDLTGDLQTAHREQIHAEKQMEVMKFGVDVDKQRNKVEAATGMMVEGINNERRERQRKRQRKGGAK